MSLLDKFLGKPPKEIVRYCDSCNNETSFLYQGKKSTKTGNKEIYKCKKCGNIRKMKNKFNI